MPDNQNPFLSGIWAPMPTELDLGELKVTGEIPRALRGRYLRMGPNPLKPDPRVYHPFIGDGMVHGIELADGHANWYRSRFVRSHRAAALLGVDPAPGVRHDPGDTVNTSVALVGGEILGMIEGGSTPVALTADLGGQTYTDFGGTLSGAFSAHPHHDPLTGEYHAITYNWTQPGKAAHLVVDRSGRVIREEPLGLPHGPMLHDCAITSRYVLVLDMPAAFLPEAAGSPFPYAWQPGLPCRVGLLPRRGRAEDIIWCDAPLSYVYHAANAHDAEDGRVVLDVCAFSSMFSESSDRNRGLERWVLDPHTRTIEITPIDTTPQEFPRIDERRFGQRHRFITTLSQPTDPADPAPAGSALYRHDVETGRKQVHDFGAGHCPGEFMFVPRTADNPEGDGWLIGLVIDTIDDTSDLVLLDTLDFEGRPVACVHLPHRIPPGFHGNWVSDADLSKPEAV